MAYVGEFQDHRAGDLLDGEVAGHPVHVRADDFHGGADESHTRVARGVQEVPSHEVPVALFHAGVDAAGGDDDLRLRTGRVTAVEVEAALVLQERPAHGGHHGVAHREADPAVCGVDRPFPVRAASPGSGRTAVAVADDPVGGWEMSAGSVRSVRRNVVPRLNKFMHHLITARDLLPQAVLHSRRNIHVFATRFPEM